MRNGRDVVGWGLLGWGDGMGVVELGDLCFVKGWVVCWFRLVR